MEKNLELENKYNWSKRIDKYGRIYLYRVSSVVLDKITLEKHLCTVMNTFEGVGVLAVKMNDETKVGIVTQKVTPLLVADVSKRVDEIAVNFVMGDKVIEIIDFSGVVSV